MANTAEKEVGLFDTKIFGHPSGLFVLFFTEMWERFSFYGMRVLLVNFLTMTLIGYNPGWEWSVENAGALYGTYAGLIYLTPILGGMIADKYLGYKLTVTLGALIMTFGHAAMALDTEISLYAGLALLVIGTGFFKPNITSIISEMYKELPEKKDGAFTIYYMGVNAGAFFGMLLCGYMAAKLGWAWGFGLAGVFMLFGTLQFWLAGKLFGKIGDKPKEIREAQNEEHEVIDAKEVEPETKRNPFTLLDKILTVICSVIGLAYLINDPMSKLGGANLFNFEVGALSGQNVVVLFGLLLFLVLVIRRISRYERVVRDRMIAFVIFAFFTVFFWMAFEQGASSLVIFARDNVDRVLSGDAALIFNIVNALLVIIPLGIITWVLWLLGKRTFKTIPVSNVVLVICFASMWALVIWKINRDFNTTGYDVTYQTVKMPDLDDKGKQKKTKKGELIFKNVPVTIETSQSQVDSLVAAGGILKTEEIAEIADLEDLEKGQAIYIIREDKDSEAFGYVAEDRLDEFKERGKELKRDNGLIQATVVKVKANEVKIEESWFSILNSFFIIAFASLFSRWWDSKYNPSGSVKFALGLIVMAVGFGLLAFGAYGVEDGDKVSMIWLILAYLFHTLGELCLSPVGLSYVSKLVPGRMIAFMFGMWYLAIAIGNKLAAVIGGEIENITEQYNLSTFFLIFTIVPITAGIIVLLLGPLLKKLMHGIK